MGHLQADIERFIDLVEEQITVVAIVGINRPEIVDSANVFREVVDIFRCVVMIAKNLNHVVELVERHIGHARHPKAIENFVGNFVANHRSDPVDENRIGFAAMRRLIHRLLLYDTRKTRPKLMN